MTTKKSRTPTLAAAEAKQTQDFIHKTIERYRGPAGDLESALGMFLLGRYLGWRALYVLHSKKTVSKYESILGIEVQSAFEPVGPDAHRSPGYLAADSRPNFWRVVSGEDVIDSKERRQIQ
jgi:hypothetical protein